MSQAKKLSRHMSRQSSICETTSVGSTKSDAPPKSHSSSSTSSAGGGSDYTINSNGSNSNYNFKTKSNVTLNKLSINGQGSDNDHIRSASILNVAEMILHGVADNEILEIWLKSIECEEFLHKFTDAGYDMPTISRITPQDLTAIGVKDPNKRLKILTEIKKLNLQDGLPTFKPASLSHWLSLLRLDSYYYKSLCDQQVDTIEKMCQLTWEDFEELGISKLGHQKRFQLAIERYKELDSDSKCPTKTISEPIYDINPSQILLVASTENHSINGPIMNKQSSTGELSSTGSGSMHSVYSAASTHYQPTYGSLQQTDNNNHPIAGQQPVNTPQQTPQHQQQQPIYSQPPPPPLIYQSPAQLLSAIMPPKQPPQQSHYQPIIPKQQQQLPQVPLPPQAPQLMNMPQKAVGNTSNQQPQMFSDTSSLNGSSNMSAIMPPANNLATAGLSSNRQSMSQLAFNAQIANLPKHQQQLLQQSSIYATLSRQPGKTRQPPPPVPIRTNSLKTNSLTDEMAQLDYSTQLQQTTSGSTLMRSGTNRIPNGIMNCNRNQFNSQTMLSKNKSFSGHNAQMEASRARFLNNYNNNFDDPTNPQLSSPHPQPPQQFHQPDQMPIYGMTGMPAATTTSLARQQQVCNATTGKDDDFPPPPSPLSMSEQEAEEVSLNLDASNFTDVNHASQMLSFRVGI